MKMVKSHTRKKSADRTPPELRVLTNHLADHLKHWTAKQLDTFQSQQEVICLPTKHGYKIGLYNLRVFPNKMTEVWDRNHELIHVFREKVSAVLYTIYTIKKQYWIANDIKYLDQEINKNYTDILTMRKCMESAVKRGDYVYADIRQARLDTAQYKLTRAQEQLSAIHRRAKIAKVWE